MKNVIPDFGIQGEFGLTGCYQNLLFGQHIGVSDPIYKGCHQITVDTDLLNLYRLADPKDSINRSSELPEIALRQQVNASGGNNLQFL